MILQQPKFNATDTGYASCSTCTPGCQRFEFECFGCDKVKARAKFSKVQLRDPDKAVSATSSSIACYSTLTISAAVLGLLQGAVQY